MRRFFKLALFAVEMASAPTVGYLIDFDGSAGRPSLSQALASNVAVSVEDSPVRFRFRVPGISEFREFIRTPRRSALPDVRVVPRPVA
jgi:hypothetical protein